MEEKEKKEFNAYKVFLDFKADIFIEDLTRTVPTSKGCSCSSGSSSTTSGTGPSSNFMTFYLPFIASGII